tara:strand:- start:79403 stop:79927 length:525 start_codon:yes stop_codon:yes gene_type:complete
MSKNLNEEFDIFEQLDIRADLKQDKKWIYNKRFNEPKLYYEIDNETKIVIGFIGYNKAYITDDNHRENDELRKSMVVKMLKLVDSDYDRYEKIFTKILPYSWLGKDSGLIKKLRKTLLSHYEKEEMERKEEEGEKERIKNDKEYAEKKMEFEKKMSKVPVFYLRKNTIDSLLED